MRRLAPFGFFVVLGCLFLWKVVFAGQVFVPAALLRYLVPWAAETRPPWNPLMYDSVGQFYPWRQFASETLRAGTIPLWNPYQFCGTPFVANSQSAVFYPGNLLFYLLPTAKAAGWTVILHLSLAGAFTFAFLRRFGISSMAAAAGGAAFAFSTWQVSWLHLPTFLCTSCWLPLVLDRTHTLREATTARNTVLLGLAIGMSLLAGHLQIAFYVLMAAGLLAIWPMRRRTEGEEPPASSDNPRRILPLRCPRFAMGWAAALAFGGMLAAPQVLPTLELSKHSHRVAPATASGYKAYTDYSPSPASLITLFLPDFFGNPSSTDRPYQGVSRGRGLFNYAEGAMYVGIPTLFFAALGLLTARKRSPPVPFLGALAGLSMLIALGTLVDSLLYFYVPGFSQSGSPGRSLVLWAFGMSGLAAFGCEEVIQARLTWRGLAAATGTVLAAFGLTIAAGMTGAAGEPQGAAAGAIRAIALIAASAAASALIWRSATRRRALALTALPAALILADLFSTGIGYNPTARAEDVFPATPLIQELKARAGHDRIAPINPRNFSFRGPDAILPPNGAMVFGLRDLQGYDSLFLGRYKAFLDEVAKEVDPQYKASPPEVGNMVFAKDPLSPLIPMAGVRLIVSSKPLTLNGASAGYVEGAFVYEFEANPGRVSLTNGAKSQWIEDGATRIKMEIDSPAAATLTLADQVYPGWKLSINGASADILPFQTVFRQTAVPAGRSTVAFTYKPTSFLAGLYLALVSLAICAGIVITGRSNRLLGVS